MPQGAWSGKRERQYKKIKSGQKKRGRSDRTAKRIAAATVNKERARSGEAKTSSRGSTRRKTSRAAGRSRSTTGGRGGRTKEQLYKEAQRRGVTGRSSMSKAQLERALRRK